MFLSVNLCPQHTATTRPKPAARVRGATASPPARTRPAPPARVRSGETTPWRLTSPPTDAPWSPPPPPPPAPRLPPRARADPETRPAPPSWTPPPTAPPSSRSRRETARNLDTLIRSGEEAAYLRTCAGELRRARFVRAGEVGSPHTQNKLELYTIRVPGNHGLAWSRFI